MVVIAVCLPVLMMLLMLGMDAFENAISPPPPPPPEAGTDVRIPTPALGETQQGP